MKIIQSFAQFKEGSPYKMNKNIYLNFYSFYLSYLTLNKYYGNVTMICNEEAFNSFIKYIPYDEIIFMKNNNSFDFWSVYKIDAMKLVSDDLIHVDSDVFIFDDLFRDFIDGDYDILSQDVQKWNDNNTMKNYVNNNAKFLLDSNIIDAKIFDNKIASGGVLGLKNNVKEKYFDAVDKTYDAMKNNKIVDTNLKPVILEELTLYLVAISNEYKIYTILPNDLISKYGLTDAGNKKKYVHMWFDSRFDDRNITLIKNKIRLEFPHNYSLVDKYEMNVLKEIKTQHERIYN